MAQVFDNRDEAGEKARSGQLTIRDICGPEAVGDRIARRIRSIHESVLPHYERDNHLEERSLSELNESMVRLEVSTQVLVAATEKWHAAKSLDVMKSGRVPILSGIVRIFLRPLLLGRLNDRIAEVLSLQLQAQRHLLEVLRQICGQFEREE